MYSKKELKHLKCAFKILESKINNYEAFTNSQRVQQYCQLKLAHYEHEVFFVLFLNTQHQLIEAHEMFRGTVNASGVYPREVAKKALELNSSAVIFSHNHPSGSLEPSSADIGITRHLKEVLQLFDIRVLDHIIVSNTGSTSMSERGVV